MKNKFVADTLNDIADLLDIKGEGFFKIRAYRQGAQVIGDLSEDIEKVIAAGRLAELPHIGDALAKKITELVETGKLAYLNELREEVPTSLLELLRIPSMGPKKVSAVWHELGVTDLCSLREAAETNQLQKLDGFGVTSEKNVLRGIQLREQTQGRFLLHVALEDAEDLVTYMDTCDSCKEVSLAGSIRRRKETIGDIDILVSSNDAKTVMDHLKAYEDLENVMLSGNTKTSIRLKDGMQVDLRVVQTENFGAALQYFTGSKEHNINVRGIAVKKNWKLNEYGLYDKNGKPLAGKTEEDIYKQLGMSWIPPELRENRGEVAYAKNHKTPRLVEEGDIRGDLHTHSVWSDGSKTIEQMARTAKELGYEYLAISDHSQSLTAANGLKPERVDEKLKEIHNVNKAIGPGLQLLCGTECDILKDGSLDYPDDVLEKFDIVYAAIHSHFNMDGKQATERICKAIKNPHVNALAHPTCRILRIREGFDLDIEQVIDTAIENNVALEINAFPDRLDLRDTHVKLARDKGAHFLIGSDAHNTCYLPYMKYGVSVARRGWLEPKHILNTLPLNTMIKRLRGEK